MADSQRWIEFPNRMVYHIARETPMIRTLCSSYAPFPLPHTAYIVATRSEGRRMCKECFKRAVRQKLKLPPRSAWEYAQWAGEHA